MVIFFHNRHTEPLQGLIRRLQAALALTSDETDALAELARNIEHETTCAPYQLWQRDQKTVAAKP